MKVTHPHPIKLADHLEELAKRLRQDGSKAIHHARLLSTRGYPSSSGFDAIGSTVSAESSVEREALDPSGDGRELAVLADLMRKTWTYAFDLMSRVDGLVAHATAADSYDEDRGCLSCRRDGGAWEPTDRYAQWCRWCGDYKSANGQMPSIEDVRAHRRGQTIRVRVTERH